MAPQGRQRKILRHRVLLGAPAVAVMAVFTCVVPVRGATTERIAVDRHTGLAISGFDPVAYFTDGAAKLGRADFEYAASGVVWRFTNEGNRAAFVADPDVYSPQFGGYDPVAIARGASTQGHPQIWLISGQRLFLFYSSEARDAFAADPEASLRAAQERWPDVLRTLSP